MNLNLKEEPNAELVKMITDEEGEEVEDEVTSQLILLARKLKRNEITQTQVNMPQAPVFSFAARMVKINFYTTKDRAPIYKFTMDVDLNDRVDQLILKVQTKRVGKHVNANLVTVYLGPENRPN